MEPILIKILKYWAAVLSDKFASEASGPQKTKNELGRHFLSENSHSQALLSFIKAWALSASLPIDQLIHIARAICKPL
jgi:hypothetical protein